MTLTPCQSKTGEALIASATGEAVTCPVGVVIVLLASFGGGAAQLQDDDDDFDFMVEQHGLLPPAVKRTVDLFTIKTPDGNANRLYDARFRDAMIAIGFVRESAYDLLPATPVPGVNYDPPGSGFISSSAYTGLIDRFEQAHGFTPSSMLLGVDHRHPNSTIGEWGLDALGMDPIGVEAIGFDHFARRDSLVSAARTIRDGGTRIEMNEFPEYPPSFEALGTAFAGRHFRYIGQLLERARTLYLGGSSP